MSIDKLEELQSIIDAQVVPDSSRVGANALISEIDEDWIIAKLGEAIQNTYQAGIHETPHTDGYYISEFISDDQLMRLYTKVHDKLYIDVSLGKSLKVSIGNRNLPHWELASKQVGLSASGGDGKHYKWDRIFRSLTKALANLSEYKALRLSNDE